MATIKQHAPRPLSGWLGVALNCLLFFTSGCSVFGGASVEEAPYELVAKDGKFEVRDYARQVVAQTQVSASFSNAGNQAFRKLFDYISGENQANSKIAMTAPVVAESDLASDAESATGDKIAMTAPVTYQLDNGTWRYQFVLPQSFNIDNTPQPLNPEVSILETEGRRVASVTYAWLATDKARERNTNALLQWIAEQGLEIKSKPRWAGYNPPWTLPPFRRNEVLIDIAGSR